MDGTFKVVRGGKKMFYQMLIISAYCKGDCFVLCLDLDFKFLPYMAVYSCLLDHSDWQELCDV